MTAPTQDSAHARLLRRALALYPASYGPGAVAEIADHAERRIAAAGPLAGLREVADVAGHAARVRIGLVPHRPLGRAFGAAAPLAALLTGTFAATLLWAAADEAADPWLVTPDTAPTAGPLLSVALVLVPATLAALAALFGRWSGTRALALATVAASPLYLLLAATGLLGGTAGSPYFDLGGGELGLIALNSLVLLLAPPDLARPRPAVLWAAVASFVVPDAILMATAGAGSPVLIAAPIVLGAAVAGTTSGAGSAALVAVVLAAPPVLAFAAVGRYTPGTSLLWLAVPFTLGYLTARGALWAARRTTARPGLRRS
ncbi:hypothetical protein ACWGB8_24405 [Kitasatospora sp. NPDC054939]